MKKYLWLATAAIVLTGCTSGTSTITFGDHDATPSASPSVSYTWPPTSACGQERWPVKTGTDADVSKIDLNTVVNTTVQQMNSLTAPSNPPQSGRVSPVETTLYRISATLTGYKEEADSDYHLILSVVTPTGTQNMIAEIPDPACVGNQSTNPLLPGIELARTQFDAKFGPISPGSFTNVNVPVTVTGVGFWDRIHGQSGVADNGVELHPLQGIMFGN